MSADRPRIQTGATCIAIAHSVSPAAHAACSCITHMSAHRRRTGGTLVVPPSTHRGACAGVHTPRALTSARSCSSPSHARRRRTSSAGRRTSSRTSHYAAARSARPTSGAGSRRTSGADSRLTSAAGSPTTRRARRTAHRTDLLRSVSTRLQSRRRVGVPPAAMCSRARLVAARRSSAAMA